MRKGTNRFERERLNKKRRWRNVQAVCVIVILISAFFITKMLFSKFKVRQEEKAARDVMQQLLLADSTSEESNATFNPYTGTDYSNVKPNVLEQFDALLESNSDFVGMVSFGEDTSLYVCQGEDNMYYGAHRFDGSEDPGGMIFMDCRNCIWPRSENIILYGHNMRDGSRFGKLNRYLKKEHLVEYPTFRFASLYGFDDYIIFAVFYASVDTSNSGFFNFAQTNFVNQDAFDEYIQTVKSKSLLFLSVDVEYGEKLLTLATCSGEDQERLIIVCRALRPDEISDAANTTFD